MFRHQGPERTPRQNGVLALYLAMIGGFVNSAGFILIGSFTSHVTGNVGRFANDLLSRQFHAALSAAVMIFAFLLGAFMASLIIESNAFDRTSYAYGVALSFEATLLVVFIAVGGLIAGSILQDVAAALLCIAMGMQNSLVTRLSGAVVRTTHLTGVVTDFGIEVSRWYRWWRVRGQSSSETRLVGRNPPERPAPAKIRLLGTIAVSFSLGSLLGGGAALLLRHGAMFIPSAALCLAAGYAFKAGAESGSSIAPPPSASVE